MAESKPVNEILAEALTHYAGMPMEGGAVLEKPDHALFQGIVEGVFAQSAALQDTVLQALGQGKNVTPTSNPLLLAILVCGAYELKNHYRIDMPIIISDYINVAHAFFDQNEAKLVNAVLDRIGKDIAAASPKELSK